MKLLTDKKYYELNAKLWDQEQELTRKNTEIYSLKCKCDLVSKLVAQNQQLSAKVSELEPIVEKFNHKNNLEKARKQKYRSKLRLHKREATKTATPAIEMSEVEKFARENVGRELTLTGYGNKVGYVAGFGNECGEIIVGFKHSSGWVIGAHNRKDKVILKKYQSYLWATFSEIKLK